MLVNSEHVNARNKKSEFNIVQIDHVDQKSQKRATARVRNDTFCQFRFQTQNVKDHKKDIE